MNKEDVAAILLEQRRWMTAHEIAVRLEVDVDDVHRALLRLLAEKRVSSIVDRHNLITERWGIRLTKKEQP